ncbi:hypothetical protein [Labilithrix luteola]|uniref:hypothetical protein n=1 Tax=Labilithrix luteola TaxID=1391654 RepID=UPI001475C1C2|nr:hypothetical protein [Labilithrix luteola]
MSAASTSHWGSAWRSELSSLMRISAGTEARTAATAPPPITVPNRVTSDAPSSSSSSGS